MRAACCALALTFVLASCGGSASSAPPPPSERLTVERDALAGVFIDGGKGRPVLLLGGSEGGTPSLRAAVALAKAGHPVLGLAYFGEPGLPRDLDDIPLEYIRRRARYLRRRTGRKPDIVGSSRGGELALLMAATYPLDFDAVAAYVPSAYVVGGFPNPGPAWTRGGHPVPSLDSMDFGVPHPHGSDVRRAAIRIDRYGGPVLLVGAGDDGVWPSAAYVRTLDARRHAITTRVYPHAGHGVGAIVPTSVPSRPDLGGTAAADLAARRDAWPALLHILR